MKHYLFDTQAGRLLAEDTDVVDCTPTLPPHIVPLGQLLASEDFPYAADPYPKLNAAEWQPEDYRALGMVALDSLRAEGLLDEAVSWRHLQRLYKLGLGPDSHRYTRHAGSKYSSLTDFQKDIGSPFNNANGAFIDWTVEDYTNHAKTLIRNLGKVPSACDYKASAREGIGPSYDVIKYRVGGIRSLHDRLGYPNVTEWEKQDYVDWGVQVIEANPNVGFTRDLCDVLSPKKRGPSTRNVLVTFEKWSVFKGEVLKEKSVMNDTADLSAVRDEKIVTYLAMVKSGRLPPSYANLDPHRLLKKSARYLIVQQCLQGEKQQVIESIATKDAFVREILRRNNEITAGHVENVAVRHDLYDDVWPAENPRDYLRVTSTELEKYRKRNAEKWRQHKLNVNLNKQQLC